MAGCRTLLIADHVGLPIAQLPLREGRLRRWHFAAFATLGAVAAMVWVGADVAALVLLSFRARYTVIKPPTQLLVRGGLRLWMSARLVVVTEPRFCYRSVYVDELSHVDYVRLRRLLRYAATLPVGERLPPFEFALV